MGNLKETGGGKDFHKANWGSALLAASGVAPHCQLIVHEIIMNH
jgi:hypothetical protein